jgi:hypothetical protein
VNEYWPPLVVRRWQGVLFSRDPGDFDWDHDPVREAVISRRLHELRGLVVGQVAEIEALLLHIAQEARDRYPGTLPAWQKRKGAGGALQDVRRLLAALAVGEEFAEELEKIGRIINRRNRLVHGVIHIGFARLGYDYRAPLQPVIYLLFENDGDEAPPPVADQGTTDSPELSDPWDEEEEGEPDEDAELDEFALEKYMNEAYEALDAGLVILAGVDGVLPERLTGEPATDDDPTVRTFAFTAAGSPDRRAYGCSEGEERAREHGNRPSDESDEAGGSPTHGEVR